MEVCTLYSVYSIEKWKELVAFLPIIIHYNFKFFKVAEKIRESHC